MSAEVSHRNHLNVLDPHLIQNAKWEARHQIASNIFLKNSPPIWVSGNVIKGRINRGKEVSSQA